MGPGETQCLREKLVTGLVWQTTEPRVLESRFSGHREAKKAVFCGFSRFPCDKTAKNAGLALFFHRKLV